MEVKLEVGPYMSQGRRCHRVFQWRWCSCVCGILTWAVLYIYIYILSQVIKQKWERQYCKDVLHYYSINFLVFIMYIYFNKIPFYKMNASKSLLKHGQKSTTNFLYMWCVPHGSDDVSTLTVIRFQRCRPSMSGTVLMGTNQKEDSPVKMACRVIEVMLTGCNGVFKGVIMSWTLTAITTQLNTLEGSRLQKCGCEYP